MSKSNYDWTGTPTKLGDGTWGVRIDTWQGGETTSHMDDCGTSGWTSWEKEPRAGDRVKITTKSGKSWIATLEGGCHIKRNRWSGDSWWICGTVQRGGKKKAAPMPEPETRAERTARQQARYEEYKHLRTADGRVPHFVTAMFMAIGATEEECEEIDRWKDEAKEGCYY